MKKLVALFLVLMVASSSLACASADTDMQPYLLGEFQIEVPADWAYWNETDGSMIYFAPSVQDEQTMLAVAMYPHSTEAVTAEDDLYSLVNMLYGDMAPSAGIPVEFTDENGFLMGSFEILTSSGDEIVSHGLVCNSESSIMLILYFNTLVSDNQEKAEFDDICKTVSLVGEDYFDYSIDTLYNKSLSDLVELQRMITMAMWNTNDWQEVEVPQGVWIVGEDIPAGTWTVRCADIGRDSYMMKECDLSWGEALDEDGPYIKRSGRWDKAIIYNPNNENYDEGELTEYTFTVEEGDYIVIDNYYNRAVFTPYSGKPALGFK